ncbi:MAG: DUF2283 domain-containing protein [Candidatus Nanoarchaeia archaeon]|nr:DUF2283 domain-containing protein [Candidatus Nanoarchaeia archaeon]
MKKHLDAKEKGQVDYDYKNDILFFKIKNREYKTSLDFGDFIIDIDNEGFATGIQVIDASKIFKRPKEDLRSVKDWQFSTKIENNIISIQLAFAITKRNKIIIQQNFEREAKSRLADSEVECTI